MNFYKILQKLGYKSSNKINNQIFIGDCIASKDREFLKNNNINVIVNCSQHIEFIKCSKIKKYRVNLNDDMCYSTIVLMVKYFKYLIPILNKHIENGDKILIHCRCGMQRSATILAGLLMYRYKIGKWEAMRIIKAKRFITFLPNSNYGLSLDIYENFLFK